MVKKNVRVTREAIEKLSRELKLLEPDEFSQDWQYEVADLNRLEEVYERIINFIKKGKK